MRPNHTLRHSFLVALAVAGLWACSAPLLAEATQNRLFGSQIRALDIDLSGNAYEIDERFTSITKRGPNNKIIWQLGSTGNLPEQFKLPVAINAQHESRIYILDKLKSSIQVFSKDGNFLFTFGGKGSAHGQLLDPNGPLIISNGKVIVSDTGNRRLQLFDLEGSPLGTLRPKGLEDFEPTAIAITSQGSMTTYDNASHRFIVFDTESGTSSALNINLGDISPQQILATRQFIYVLDITKQLYRFKPDDSQPTALELTRDHKPLLLLTAPKHPAAYLFRTPHATRLMHLEY